MPESSFAKSNQADQQLLPPERRGWGVWPWMGLLLAVVVMVVLRGTSRPPPEPRGEHHPAVGKQVTRFHLEPLTGDSREVSIGDLEEKVTLINFWGPWCSACVVEFPHLVELEQHFRGQSGFQFFSISSNYNPADQTGLAENTEQFLKAHKADFPAYRDPQGQTTMALIQAAKIEEFGYPATVLLGKGGLIRGIWIGYYPGDETAVRQAIEKVLHEFDNKS